MWSAAAMPPLFGATAAAWPPHSRRGARMPKAILYDATLCIDCKQCEQACANQNKNPYDDTIAKEQRTSDHKFTYVADTHGNDKFMRKLCMNCLDPTCVSVCPVGALVKHKEGPVSYNADACMGCRYCMVACPFGVPKYEWTKTVPRVRKCIMCPDRVLAGKPTACAEACPTGATLFGEREALIAEARKRIAAEPGKYVPTIYGLNEVGGTSVLILSSVPVEKFGYPRISERPLPPLTADVLEHVPQVVTVGWAVLGGIWWITNRRDIVKENDQ
jgi:formate dehydrogenase iron-sulfur subunit